METSTETFAECLRRLGSNRSDEGAWSKLYARLRPLLYATCYRLLRGHPQLAEDAVQETILKLFRYARFAEFAANPEAFYSYALAVGRNVSFEYLRHLRRNAEEDDLESVDVVAVEKDNPESYAIRSKLLAQAVLELNAEDQKLLNLLLQGYSTPEIAGRTGLKYSNTGVRIHRLRAHLRNMLKRQS